MMKTLMRAPCDGLVLVGTLSLLACGGASSEDTAPPTSNAASEMGQAQQALQYGYNTYNTIGVWLRAAPCDTCSTLVWANPGTAFHVYDTRNSPGWTYGYFRFADNSVQHGYIRNKSPSGTQVLADLHDCCDKP